ncbi:hypothetical protein DDZ18_01110 [Marinicauda salina]|uniref:Uncharacterized protein n=1 Tax=Marinicauda salina TaxID=2135793 RepID=A0A2U2BW66_9PROT|nr:hypothetical protein [Marinicauda salina]PWE18237.1 hypothetical protein DDZ18_01110 [Marinicauda salina]
MRRTLLTAALAAGVTAAAQAEHHDHPLAGAWDVGDGRTLTILPEGYAVGVYGNVAMHILEVAMEGDHLVISGLVPPPGAAPCETDGVYGWSIEDEVLELTVVDDACANRAEALDGAAFARRTPPAPPTAAGEVDDSADDGAGEGDG